MNNTKVIAIFDFDKTITSKHTFIRFLQLMHGKPYFYGRLFQLLPSVILYKIGKINLMELREKAIVKFYKGVNKVQYDRLCKEFVYDYVNFWLLDEAVKKIKWHKSQQHKLVLLSNSPIDYLQVWARQFDFDYVIASEFEFVDGVSTGKLVGDHCFGKEKVNKLKKEVVDINEYYIYGYGDSVGDKDFLQISDKAYYKFFNLKKIYKWENT